MLCLVVFSTNFVVFVYIMLSWECYVMKGGPLKQLVLMMIEEEETEESWDY